VHRRKLARAATLGAAFAVLSACYSYTAFPPSGPKVGERVRVRVSGVEAERLESMVGVRDRAVEGDFLEQADSGIALAVPLPIAPSSENGTFGQQPQQRIVIARADVQDMERRRLDKVRTSLLVGGAVAGVAAIALAKGSTLLGSGSSGGSPNETRIPPGRPVLGWSVSLPRLIGALHGRGRIGGP
jgi:hypothetical protein